MGANNTLSVTAKFITESGHNTLLQLVRPRIPSPLLTWLCMAANSLTYGCGVSER
jgi:hypothetical protein